MNFLSEFVDIKPLYKYININITREIITALLFGSFTFQGLTGVLNETRVDFK